MTAAFPAPGDEIGRFRVLRQLGAGGMGVVYEALEVNLDRRVALKVISPMFAHDPDFRSRFGREARALASLDSPHVVQVYAHGEEDGYLYIATQLIPDGDLGQMVSRWGPAPLGKALDLIEQVASGLADAHAAGLVHRDIKPGNVFVRRRTKTTVQAYLGDFGIARRVDAEATRIGTAVVGTPSYMAPELHGGAHAGPATDIYSVGCLLWVVLTGEPPYGGTTEFEVIGGHVTKPVPQLPDRSPLTRTVNHVLRVAMAKEPGHRYRSALALRDDLREAARMVDDPNHGRLASALVVPGAPAAAPPPSSYPSAVSPAVSPPSPPHATPSGPLPAHAAPTGQQHQPPYRPPHQPAPHQPQWASTPAPRRSRAGLWTGLTAAALVVAGGAVAAVVLGSGGDDPDPDRPTAAERAFAEQGYTEIQSETAKAMRVLDSVRISGEIPYNGVDSSIDMTITSAGDCDGTLKVGDGTAAVRRIEGEAYLKPDVAFFVASGQPQATAEQAAKLIGDRWVKGDESDAAQFDSFCDIDAIIGEASSSSPSSGADGSESGTVGDIEQVDGEYGVKLVAEDPTGNTNAWVSLSEPHYFLRLQLEGEDADFRFSEFDEPLGVEAPPESEVIDSSTFN
ncbi:serine/threonine-protein kinase [Nocardioides marinquilinus]|uniref:serine/threonine-protein kinase n=1 Tax=Nocardioides marinquilinus TaxID=1210400 RepID=UPI0031E8C519